MAETLLQKAQRLGIKPAQKAPLSFKEKAQSIATGVAKGGLETVIGTAGLLQKGGQAIIAGFDPTRTYKEVKEQTGFPSLKGEPEAQISEQLKAKNEYEKAGKVVEFVAELIWPVGRAEEVVSLATKGKKIAISGLDNLAEKAQSVADTDVRGRLVD